MTTTYGGGSVFTQGCNFADIDNDGFLDVFICHDTGKPKVYMGNGTSNGWVFNNTVMPLSQYPILMDPDSNSGNYASIWTDINNDNLVDLMVTHCRQSISSNTDPRRIDQVFINNGNGTYTQDTTNWTGLRDGAQGWSTAWGDIDNDGDMDAFVLNYDVNSKLMINNGNGVFNNDSAVLIGVLGGAAGLLLEPLAMRHHDGLKPPKKGSLQPYAIQPYSVGITPTRGGAAASVVFGF